MTSRARSHRLQVLDAGEPLDGVLGLPSGPPPDPSAGHADGRVPLAICCDGVAASLAATNDVADHLNQVGLATFRFTFRGRWPGGDMTGVSLLTEVADLDAVVDAARAGAASGQGPWAAIDAERLVLLGQSQGGAVALLTAARRPRLFAAVVAWHPALSIVDDLHRGLGSLDKVGETFSWMGQTLGRRYAADVWDLDIYAEIAGYTGPALIVHGTTDSLVPVSYGRRAARVLPHARFVPVPGAGHGFQREELEAALAATDDHLRRVGLL